MPDLPSGTYEFEWENLTPMTRAEITETALAQWRTFVDDPEASLPWNASLAVDAQGTLQRVHLTVRWERSA